MHTETKKCRNTLNVNISWCSLIHFKGTALQSGHVILKRVFFENFCILVTISNHIIWGIETYVSLICLLSVDNLGKDKLQEENKGFWKFACVKCYTTSCNLKGVLLHLLWLIYVIKGIQDMSHLFMNGLISIMVIMLKQCPVLSTDALHNYCMSHNWI